jgi:hypothetical protein
MIDRAALLKKVRSFLLAGKQGSPLKVISLKRLNADGQPTGQIEDWAVTREWDVDSNVSAMVETAETDATGLGDVQKYQFEFYFGGKTPGAVLPFVMYGMPDGEEASFGKSEPATSKGQIAQHMHKLAVGGSAEIIRILRTENDALRAQMQTLFDDRMKVMQTYESLISDKHKRDLEIREMETSERIRTEAVKAVMPLLPTVVNRFMGTKLLPESTNPLVDSLKGALKSIPADKWPKLMELFADDPAVIAPILEAVQFFRAQEEAAAPTP